MHRTPAVFLLALGLLGTVVARPARSQEARPPADLKKLARDAGHAVVKLRVLDRFGNELGTGSGFFVDPEGLIVTNHHVIDKGSRIEAVLSNRRTLRVAGVAATDLPNDLAVVKVDEGPFPALDLADSAAVEPGLRVWVLGSPLGLEGTLSEGIVSALRDGRDVPGGHGLPVLQIDAAISPGSSGSPVMNYDGEVVGVAVSQMVFGQNLNFAVPSAAVRELLGRVDSSVPPLPLGAVTAASALTYARNLLISLIFFGAIYLGFRYLR